MRPVLAPSESTWGGIAVFREPSSTLPVVAPLLPRRGNNQVDMYGEKDSGVGVLPDKVFALAALYVDAALHGRKFPGFEDNEFVSVPASAVPSDNKELRIRFYRVLHSRWWRVLYITSSLLHIALATIERPTMFPALGTAGYTTAFALEWVFVLVYAVDLWLSLMVSVNARAFLKQPWRLARLLLLLVVLADLTNVLALGIDFNAFRFSRGLRPFLLIFRLRNLRKVFAACVTTIGRAALIFCVIAFVVVLFGFVGYAIMNDLVTGECQWVGVGSDFGDAVGCTSACSFCAMRLQRLSRENTCCCCQA